MSSEQDLLYPAFQKFYSALNSLERFHKEKSFFENISSLDTFFSEFRNVTFVLQKSLAHTDYKLLYENLREKYFSGLKWFVDTRNETTKQHPFELIKQIELTIYTPCQADTVFSELFTVENDIALSTLIDRIKMRFCEINKVEVFFSAQISFFQKGHRENLRTNLMFGVKQMADFLSELYADINQTSALCLQIIDRIKKMSFLRMPDDMFAIDDYAYYPQKDYFEKASRIAFFGQKQNDKSFLNIPPPKTLSKGSMQDWHLPNFRAIGMDQFHQFVVMHISMCCGKIAPKNLNILPTIMIIYDDDTYDLDAFQGDLPTTVYRKFHEVAKTILTNNIKEVFVEMPCFKYTPNKHGENLIAAEREAAAQDEYLLLIKLTCDLEQKEYVFHSSILDNDYALGQIIRQGGTPIIYGEHYMAPIIQAFKQKKEKSAQAE